MDYTDNTAYIIDLIATQNKARLVQILVFGVLTACSLAGRCTVLEEHANPFQGGSTVRLVSL
jgi:hypothetical protein